MEAWDCEPQEILDEESGQMVPVIVAVLYRGAPGLEIEADRCLMNYWTKELALLFKLYDLMISGRGYPHGDGGYMKQPARLLAAFDAIDVYTAELSEMG